MSGFESHAKTCTQNNAQNNAQNTLQLRVKICGMTQPDQGRAIAEMGATALGFICTPRSPRYVSPDQIARVVAALPRDETTGIPRCDRVGVFVNAAVKDIAQTVAIADLNGIQLHGDESPELCDRVRHACPNTEVIKALRIKTPDALTQTTSYLGHVDALLLDAYHPQLLGGTGETLNWHQLQQFQPTCPWFLAGGLTPENILEALSQLSPHGIDLSSGVERSPGNKDLHRVADLFAQLRS